MHSRRQFLTAAAAAGLAAGQTRRARRPNFVVLLTDDQRFDTVRALGNPEVETPNMDRLVRGGVAFTHACTQGGLTGAICMPSRAQLLTGRSMFRVHRAIIDHQSDPDPAVKTFPELLRAEGYLTFATGKWHNGPVLFNRSFSAGSNIFFGGMFDQLKTPVHEFDPSGRYAAANATVPGTFSSELFSDAAVRFLRERDANKPYVLYVAYTSPHDPRMAPQRFSSLFPPEKVRLPRNFMPQHPFDNGELKVRDELLAPFPRTPDEVRKHIAAYYAMIAEVDFHIGRVLEAVAAFGDIENTYVVFAGDNGLAVGQHGLMGKQNLYDHSWRVPMVIGGPGTPKARRAATLCHIMDLCPTILDLAGVEPPADLDARTIRPALANESARIRQSIIAAYRGVQRAIRTDRYKLILYRVAGTETTQFFDLREDPWELRNLAGNAAQSGRIRELRQALVTQLADAGDPDADSWNS